MVLSAATLLLALAAVPAAPPILDVPCHRATSAIVIDGNAGEQAWADAAPLTEFRLLRTFGKPVTDTTVRLCYDDKHLYALFECRDEDLFVLYDKRDDNIWESDAIELFFKPIETNPIYYEFEVAPNNALFDARMVNTGSGGFKRWKAWDCDMRTAVAVRGTINDWHDRDHGYTVEVAIPLEAFSETIGDRPLDGQTWKFTAVRVDLSVTLDEAQISTTANVADGDIHHKDGYFTLTFMPAK